MNTIGIIRFLLTQIGNDIEGIFDNCWSGSSLRRGLTALTFNSWKPMLPTQLIRTFLIANSITCRSSLFFIQNRRPIADCFRCFYLYIFAAFNGFTFQPAAAHNVQPRQFKLTRRIR